ncbi:uncharacterized protein LOC143599119 [Bidens hawaiensis]|uniref:uncharacterized protein LOC143599119 n=1 Tax=Bidens hawaiensis TaxID=980011 RepID=UPI004049718E
MSIAHSTWPVVLVNYNLPPWMSLKPEYFILSLLIPGPESPALTWTISDFPGYSMLSGWKTKGTLLDISGKSKDHPKARFDLLDLKIKEKLQPKLSDDGKHVIMEKKKKFLGYKSHDAHIFLHYLLQVAVRKSLPKHVVILLIRLGVFFRSLCSKVIKPEDLDKLQLEITETLCEFEKIFPPAFFDIMVHLRIHLVNEVRLGGPVQYRWMFFMERYLCKLKSYVQNKSRPEGSIAEGYLIEECLNFYSHYMHGVNGRLNKGVEDNDGFKGENESNEPMFVNGGHPLGGKKRRQGKVTSYDVHLIEQAHRYALFNSDCEQVNDYINEHEAYIENQPRQSRWARAQNHSHEFTGWFENKVIHNDVPDHIYWLAKGPSPTFKTYYGYYANGYRFHTKSRDSKCITQNSGVSLTALTPSFASSRDKNPTVGNIDYYGRILDIIELDYWSKFRVMILFVMRSQVKQVFYAPDPIIDGLYYVLNTIPRDVYDFDEEINEADCGSYWCDPDVDRLGSFAQASDQETCLLREDIPPLKIDANTKLAATDVVDTENDDDSDYDDTLWDWMHVDDDDDN